MPPNARSSSKGKKPPPRGRPGGLASGRARKRSDNLDIWEAYQPVRGKKGEVQALANRFELSTRRVQQIGNGKRPPAACIDAQVVEQEPPIELAGPGTVAVAAESPSMSRAFAEELLGRLRGLDRHLQHLQVSLDRAQPVQPDLLGHSNLTDPVRQEVQMLVKSVKKFLFDKKQ